MKVVCIPEIEPTAIAGVSWRPLRATLGIRAFGINAYTAGPGEHVVEPHDESGGGTGRHEELYVVLGGRATFTCGGETVDAPAGTCVFLDDPAGRKRGGRRGAGGDGARDRRPGRRGLRGLAGEHYFGGYRKRQQGRPEEELALLDEGLARYPGRGSILYSRACALRGRG